MVRKMSQSLPTATTGLIKRKSQLVTASSLCLSGLTAWMWTVVIDGRALPWQVTRSWAMTFLVLFVVSMLWWWNYYEEAFGSAADSRQMTAAAGLGSAPWVLLCLAALSLVYLSDQANNILEWPYWHMQFVIGAFLLGILMYSIQRASILILRYPGLGLIAALNRAFSRHSTAIMLGCLAAVGILQGMSSVSPISDDIGKYSQAAMALLARDPYPVHIAGKDLVRAGMTADSPAVPLLPVLLAISFAIFGQTTVGLVIPLAALAAIFPLVLYWACRQLTDSRPLAYATAMLLSLFPPYQIHVLGTPVPDTLFVVVLLIVAALAAKANDDKHWKWWIALGAAVGLAANARPEGLDFSIAIMLMLAVIQWRKKQYWISVLAYLLLLAPFALTYHSVEGSLWPTTFGGTIGLQYVNSNLSLLHYFALPWYIQAIGLNAFQLSVLGVLAFFFIMVGSAALLRTRPALLFIPGLGVGYLASSLLIHPLILMSYTPVDVLRHWSSAIPYTVLTLAYGLFVSYRMLIRWIGQTPRKLLLLILVLLLYGGIYYECERLARPEPYFGGEASLLWTSSSYLFTDLLQHPIPLPASNDPRSGIEIREDMKAQLRDFDLRRVNKSESYDWSTMFVALLGVVYAVAIPRHGDNVPGHRSVYNNRGTKTPST